jgi:GT2 family glycosyltransferase
MELSIIIINYNTSNLTTNCIKTLYRHCDTSNSEIILVDNASTECDPDIFVQKFPNLKLIRSLVNLGFAEGNNLGIQQAKGEYILLLNSDMILIEDCISACLERIKIDTTIGVITPKLLNTDYSYQKNARKSPSIKFELLDILRPLIKCFPYKSYAPTFLNQYFKGDIELSCDWCYGAFFMLKRETIKKLGGQLDNRFFMYGEDELWSWQIRNLGLKIIFHSSAKIIHLDKGSTAKQNMRKVFNRAIKTQSIVYAIRNDSTIWKSSIMFKFLLYIKYIPNFLRYL